MKELLVEGVSTLDDLKPQCGQNNVFILFEKVR